MDITVRIVTKNDSLVSKTVTSKRISVKEERETLATLPGIRTKKVSTLRDVNAPPSFKLHLKNFAGECSYYRFQADGFEELVNIVTSKYRDGAPKNTRLCYQDEDGCLVRLFREEDYKEMLRVSRKAGISLILLQVGF